jgi:hypothetical protein
MSESPLHQDSSAMATWSIWGATDDEVVLTRLVDYLTDGRSGRLDVSPTDVADHS